MRLLDFASHYTARRDVSDAYWDQLRWMIAAFERTLRRTAILTDLAVEPINRHLRINRDRLSFDTRENHRRMLLTLWRAAADDGLATEPPARKIMAIKVPDKLQRAWTRDEVCRLADAAHLLSGSYGNGIQRRLYWRSYVMGAWDTGLRGCDMRRIRIEAIGEDGRCVLVQHKTGKLIRVQFHAATVQAIRASFPPDRELVWPQLGRISYWRAEARRLVKAAGLHGTIGRLRHSSGTAVEVLYPGRGHEHLGNTRTVFERHYLDHQKIDVTVLMPESLL